MTNPRQLAPTVGLSHDGFRFLEGCFEGLEGYSVGRMTKSRSGKLYIDDAGWGPEAGSIEYGYRVPFGEIHVFISNIGEPGPEPHLHRHHRDGSACMTPPGSTRREACLCWIYP